MELEGIINEHFNELNENEKAIIEYIIKNKANCQEMTIIELAKETLTSKSSILRLTQKLGFSGYSEFKYSIRKDISKQNNVGQEYDLYSMQIKDIETTKKIFEQTELTPILKQMQEAERVFCYGTGWGQRNVLADFLRSMIAVGKYPILLKAKRELEMASKSDIKPSDLLIVVSLSGDIREVEKEMGILKLKGIPIVSITSLSNNIKIKTIRQKAEEELNKKKAEEEMCYHTYPFCLSINNNLLFSYLKSYFLSALAVACYPKSKVSGFNNVFHVDVPKSQFAYRQFKRERLLFSRL